MLSKIAAILTSTLLVATSTWSQTKSGIPNGRPAYGTEVGISIMGAIVSKDTQKSVVLIKEKATSRVKALKIGHKIMDKHEVIFIQKNFIVVKKANEFLNVYKDKFAGEAIAKAKTNDTPTSSGSTFKEDGFERKDDGTGTIEVKMTSSYRDNLVNNELQKVLMQATALPHYEGSKIVGFKLSQIEEDSIFSKGGFRDQDVITSVNGIELNSISGAIKLLKSLKGETSINVDVLRDGFKREMTISVD